MLKSKPKSRIKCRAILLNLLPASLAIKCKTTGLSAPTSRPGNAAAGHRRRFFGGCRDWHKRTRQADPGKNDDGPKTGGTADVVKTAGADRARHGETAGIGENGVGDAGDDAAGGAADRFGTRPQGDDWEGKVSGMGDYVGVSTS